MDCSSLSVSQCPTDDNLGAGPINMQARTSEVQQNMRLMTYSLSLSLPLLLCPSFSQKLESSQAFSPKIGKPVGLDLS